MTKLINGALVRFVGWCWAQVAASLHQCPVDTLSRALSWPWPMTVAGPVPAQWHDALTALLPSRGGHVKEQWCFQQRGQPDSCARGLVGISLHEQPRSSLQEQPRSLPLSDHWCTGRSNDDRGGLDAPDGSQYCMCCWTVVHKVNGQQTAVMMC